MLPGKPFGEQAQEESVPCPDSIFWPRKIAIKIHIRHDEIHDDRRPAPGLRPDVSSELPRAHCTSSAVFQAVEIVRFLAQIQPRCPELVPSLAVAHARHAPNRRFENKTRGRSKRSARHRLRSTERIAQPRDHFNFALAQNQQFRILLRRSRIPNAEQSALRTDPNRGEEIIFFTRRARALAKLPVRHTSE